MITRFKIFENKETKLTFIPNDLVPYFEDKVELYLLPFIENEISDFLSTFLLNCYVEFECLSCKEDVDGVAHYKNFNKKHTKAKITGYGYGLSDGIIYLNFNLYRRKYRHNVDTNKPISVYGNFSSDVIKIIDEVNMFSNVKKYNL